MGLLHMLMRRARSGRGSLVIEGSISHASFPQVGNPHYVITFYNLFLFALYILLFSLPDFFLLLLVPIPLILLSPPLLCFALPGIDI